MSQVSIGPPELIIYGGLKTQYVQSTLTVDVRIFSKLGVNNFSWIDNLRHNALNTNPYVTTSCTIGKCKLFRIKHITLLEGETFFRNVYEIAFFEIN